MSYFLHGDKSNFPCQDTEALNIKYIQVCYKLPSRGTTIVYLTIN